jgi:hypothetical protein
MRYVRIRWIHAHEDEPVELYSELDSASCERRKVEVFSDGRMGYAGADESCNGTMLGLEPVPPIGEIASDPQFEPEEISRAEFETILKTAHRSQRLPSRS